LNISEGQIDEPIGIFDTSLQIRDTKAVETDIPASRSSECEKWASETHTGRVGTQKDKISILASLPE
jgi:hypothetical protein